MELQRNIIDNREETEEFIASMDDYTTVIPDEVTEYFLKRSGFVCPDVKVKRLISLAAQKFLSEVIHDTAQAQKVRQLGGYKRPKEKGKSILTLEDLSTVLRDYGINLRKPEYIADSMSAGTQPKKK